MLLLLILHQPDSRAATINDTQVSHSKGHYFVSFDVWIERDIKKIRAVVMDYPGWSRMSTMIKDVEILDKGNGDDRVHMTLRLCMLIYCRNLNKIQHITYVSNDHLVAELLPHEDNDFRMAQEHWRLIPEKGGTRVQYQAHIMPDFFVPPFVGPLLIKSKIRNELAITIERLEQLTAE